MERKINWSTITLKEIVDMAPSVEEVEKLVRQGEAELRRMEQEDIKNRPNFVNKAVYGDTTPSREDPNWGLPPRPEHWPTKEDLDEAKKHEINPKEALRALRRELPFAGPNTLGLRLR